MPSHNLYAARTGNQVSIGLFATKSLLEILMSDSTDGPGVGEEAEVDWKVKLRMVLLIDARKKRYMTK